MKKRVQVVLDEEEREEFRRRAIREGLSLSAWLRRAGREKLSVDRDREVPRTLQELRKFFKACDEREEGKEPDWHEHRLVIERSILDGSGDT
jgi:hypothetical protein